ncbi:unnamed protein product [Sphenostylis stenocarpa]|uniref:Secreted protein n=1 Tax=Sphenostylis stenocarpa TaxID=92480 RepID=A0AA86W0E1_9FABA|nr:unnamed protein product [Sphenostylis stenocarpa]
MAVVVCVRSLGALTCTSASDPSARLCLKPQNVTDILLAWLCGCGRDECDVSDDKKERLNHTSSTLCEECDELDPTALCCFVGIRIDVKGKERGR